MSLRRLVLVRHGESVLERRAPCPGPDLPGSHRRTDTCRPSGPRSCWRRGWVRRRSLSSDLGRCVDTAAPIAAAFGVTSVRSTPRCASGSFGRWEGLDRAGLEADDADRYARWRAGEDVIAEVGGESDAVLRERSSRAFAALLDAVQEGPDTVVAVTHGGTIWYGVHELLRITGYRLGAVHNASVTELVLGGRGPAGLDPALPHLARFNETAHLR
jgi:broad specificity phosphatase PhoE